MMYMYHKTHVPVKKKLGVGKKGNVVDIRDK